jgi:hypothetical protein
MEEHTSKLVWAWVIAAFVAGLGGGYYYGVQTGITREKAAEEMRKNEAEKEVAKAANPFEQTSTNPFEKAPANPFDDIQVNPFE